MSDIKQAWNSGLLQVRNSSFEHGCTVGHASLTRDALGQSLACFVLWLPEGYMSNDSWWDNSFMYVLANLVDSRVDVLFDFRMDFGEISRQGSFPLRQEVQGGYDPLRGPEDFSDKEVFAALMEAIRPTWQVEPVEEATLALLREQAGPRPRREFDEVVATIDRWEPPT